MTTGLSTSDAARRPERATGGIEGIGLGLRSAHVDEILRDLPDVPWFEILADNHLAPGGLIPRQLEAIRAHYPLTFHCVGMSLGGVHPIDLDYLGEIRKLMRDIEPAWVSDHLSFTRFDHHNYHDLLPIPYTEESLHHLTDRVIQVQDFLGTSILVENVSRYLTYRESDVEEAEFIAELTDRTDCGLLLDINNVYVNAMNHEFDPRAFLDRIPLHRVQEIHLAGYETRDGFLLDAHNNRVTPPVWRLYEEFLSLLPETPTLIEWDKDIPEFAVLMTEASHAQDIMAKHIRNKANLKPV